MASTEFNGTLEPNGELTTEALSISPLHALSVFRNIQPAGLRPDSHSFPPALKAVVKLSAFPTGTQLHCQVTRFGFGSHVTVATALLQMYSALAHFHDARKLFEGILDSSSSSSTTSSRDVTLWNAMLSGYVRLGDLRSARDLFETMPQRNIISWTALVAGYAKASLDLQAIALFRRMQLQEEVDPDHVAILALLSACAHLGALEIHEALCHLNSQSALRAGYLEMECAKFLELDEE
ncbi:hypothetical protein Tsubulata_049727 [Turnera subulata]|uniref:Pentatricopeptide repeat-containing protein n=1 Tax=Turnera subulata TaxID=218843 RepID=A0A9Q0GAE6_9ROSI|nr:hypothetical protein Tsubulata_049727 [Turnera subulata]